MVEVLLLFCVILTASVNAVSWKPGYSCGHEAVMTEHLQQTLRSLPRSFQRYAPAPMSNNSRRMQTTTIGDEFSSIRVTFDFSRLDGAACVTPPNRRVWFQYRERAFRLAALEISVSFAVEYDLLLKLVAFSCRTSRSSGTRSDLWNQA